MILIILILFIIILIITVIAFLLLQNTYKEKYTNTKIETNSNEILHIKPLQKFGRFLEFPYYANNSSYMVSERAIIDNIGLQSIPLGSCTILSKNAPNQSFAIVKERNLFYILKKSCMALQIKSYIINSNNIEITFMLNNNVNMLNFIHFILVQPLYVEFSFNTNMTTAYTIDLKNINFTNSNSLINNNNANITNSKEIILKFQPISDISPSQDELTDKNLDACLRKDTLLNIWVYYIQEITTNFQALGRTLTINSNKASTIIYNSQYDKHQDNIIEYEFMKNISLMYYNFNYPPFTVSFILNISNKNYTSLMQTQDILFCSMGFSDDICKNRLFSIDGTIDAYDYTLCKLNFTTPYYSNYNCDLSQVCSINIPVVSNNTNIIVIATFDKNQINVFAKWQDVLNRDKQQQILYGTNKKYDAQNNISKIFENNENRPTLDNIQLVCNNNYIVKINSIQLGYINFNNLI